MKPESKISITTALLTAMLSLDAAAMEKREFASAAALVASIQHAVISSEAKGDLNADGKDDWARFIERYNPARPRVTTRQLYVLTQSRTGSYFLAAQTPPEDLPERGTSENGFAEEMTIQNGMLSFTDRNLWRNCSSAVVYKFRYYTRNWRLVGATYIETNSGSEFGYSLLIDENFLTGVQQVYSNDRVTGRYKNPPRILLLKDFSRYKDLFGQTRRMPSIC